MWKPADLAKKLGLFDVSDFYLEDNDCNDESVEGIEEKSFVARSFVKWIRLDCNSSPFALCITEIGEEDAGSLFFIS